MASKTYAIRAMNPAGFNRAGETFSGKAWRLMEDPDPLILNESQLMKVPTDAENYHQQIGQIPVHDDNNLSPGEKNTDLEKRLSRATERGDKAEKFVKERDARITLLERQVEDLTKQLDEATAPKPEVVTDPAADQAEAAHLHNEETGSAPDITQLPVQGASATEDNGAAAKTGAEAAVKPKPRG